MEKFEKFSRLSAFVSLGLLLVVMAAATAVERWAGTAVARDGVYGAPWFVALWAWCAVWSAVYVWQVRRRLHGAALLLHAAWLLILAGAGLTHVTGRRAMLHLRAGRPQTVCTPEGADTLRLPFAIKLERFDVIYYPGTDAPMDYVSRLTVYEQGRTALGGEVAMNRVFRYRGYRFYQSGYDADELGTVLQVSHDPWGIGVSYAGYGMLFLGWLMVLARRGGRFRRLLRGGGRKAGGLLLLAVGLALPGQAAAARAVPRTLPADVAADFGRLYVLYDDRVCPVQTLARQFTLRLCGADSWRGLTAEQVLTGWMFYYSSWSREPMFRIRGREVQRQLGLEGNRACLIDFLDERGRLRLQEPYGSAAVARAADQYNLLPRLYSGQLLKLFPIRSGGRTLWVGQNEALPPTLPPEERLFIQKSVNYLQQLAMARDYEGMRHVLAKMRQYQQQRGGASVPAEAAFCAERLYNAIDHVWYAALLSVVMGLAGFVLSVEAFAAGRRQVLWMGPVWGTVVGITWLYLLLMLALRGWVSGHWPLSNGYETLQFMAWIALTLGLLMQRRFRPALPMAQLVGGLALVVSAMGADHGRLTPLMPVLSSPLLSAHVLTVMTAFSLLAFMALGGVAACVTARRQGWNAASVTRLTQVGRLLLYPALALLSAGIFIGAVWANVSWGTYWSWDPKEVWALITLLVYALPLHERSLPCFRRNRVWQRYVVAAFLTVLVTYFGVNFLLGGMHSYA